jgi:hypothetical protein
MTRRHILRVLGIGAVTLSIPSAVLPASILAESRDWALQYLTREYNAYMRGRGVQGRRMTIVMGRDLHEAVEDQLSRQGILRTYTKELTNPQSRGISFKVCTLRYEGRGWRIKRFET